MCLRKKVNPRLFRLVALAGARNMIPFSVFHKICTGLMKTKRDLLFHALRMQRKHPFISAFPCELPGFPADQDLLYCITQILPQIDCLKTRLDNDQAMADRQSQKNGETRIRPFPVFNRAADPDIFIALAPVGRQTLPKALNPLGEKYKCAVGAPPHHFPACSAPGIRIRQQKIRGEAGEHSVPDGIFSLPSRFLRSGRSKLAFLRQRLLACAAPYIASRRYT